MLPPDVKEALVRVDDQVWLVPGAEAGGLNALLVEDGEVVLVGGGLPDALAERLAPHVGLLVLTSAEAAHARAARHFREVWAPHAEAAALKSVHDYLDTFDVTARDRGAVEHHLAATGWKPRPADRAYRAGGMLQLATTRWMMLDAPGTSPGVTLLLEPKRHYLYAAEFDGEEEALYGLPVADVEDLVASFEKLAKTDVAVFCGARAPPRRRGIRPMLRGKAEEIRRRDIQVLDALRTPRTLEDLTAMGLVQGRDAMGDPYRRFLERGMVEKHLARLIGADLAAARQDGRFQRVD